MPTEQGAVGPLSGIAARSSWAALALSVVWHGVVVGLSLALSHWLPRQPPELIIHEVVFVREEPKPASESSAPSPLPPSPLPPSPLPPSPLPPNPSPPVPSASVPSAPVPIAPPSKPSPPRPRPLLTAAPVVPSAVAARSGAEGPTAAAATTSSAQDGAPAPAVPATLPGYHMGAVSTPSPDYPYSARTRRRQGLVLIRLDVEADGRVSRAEVLESSGDAALDEAALGALGRWRLRPATEGGRPVAGRVEVPVRFRLE